HPLRHPRLQVPRRPTPTARSLLTVDRQGERQDHPPPPQRHRSGAVPRMDRQRPTATTHPPADAPDSRQGRRTEARTGCKTLGPGFKRKLSPCPDKEAEDVAV